MKISALACVLLLGAPLVSVGQLDQFSNTRDEDYLSARFEIENAINDGTFEADELVRLAFQCASTFDTDSQSGGCNGARIRFPPESTWPVNAGLDDVLDTLESTINFRTVSFSDIIVLAGYTALEASGGQLMPFCGGRTDATDGASFGDILVPPENNSSPADALREHFAAKGLSLSQGVALMGRPTDRFPEIGGLFEALANADVIELEGFVLGDLPAGVTDLEFALRTDIDLFDQVSIFLDDDVFFRSELASGWVQLMNADRIGIENVNVCTGVDTPTSNPVWWPRIARDFVGTRLLRCSRRSGTPPVDGSRCSVLPKTCFFGTQTCPDGVGANPVTECFCDGTDGDRIWRCQETECPATQFDPIGELDFEVEPVEPDEVDVVDEIF